MTEYVISPNLKYSTVPTRGVKRRKQKDRNTGKILHSLC